MYSLVARSTRLAVMVLLLLLVLVPSGITAELVSQASSDQVYKTDNGNVFYANSPPSPPADTSEQSHASLCSAPPSSPTFTSAESSILHDLHAALSTMQNQYFVLWLGKWTSAIDWTGAVMGTYVSATLASLSQSIQYTMPGTFDKSRKLDVEAQMVENEINKYFAQTISYYFGEDHFAIRMQAFDDMLWVVLGWLEATQFIERHSGSHYATNDLDEETQATGKEWHARQFVPAFAHRARVFYELAETGWDWRLCGGGMTWNPRLLPYKNAITNQLFISASISMYLHFPGDENCSPFLSQRGDDTSKSNDLYNDCDEHARGRYDTHYLANAKNGYRWLQHSGMLNDQGLYTDGFHIGGYRQNRSKTTCDERNEMVYTYNQGVILSGLRGLWEATGDVSYLEDGHELVRNVIRATGWKDKRSPSLTHQQKRGRDVEAEKAALPSSWYGLGSDGILMELCDPSGRCSQDGQTFKGIFFHHLTTFCTPLPAQPVRVGKTHAATKETAMLHQHSCDEYAAWVVHNARAALRTRDAKGRFGSWWGAAASQEQQSTEPEERDELEIQRPDSATDYRNQLDAYADDELKAPKKVYMSERDAEAKDKGDLNDRGRGRTIETQGSGLAVVRAMWEFVRRAQGSLDLTL